MAVINEGNLSQPMDTIHCKVAFYAIKVCVMWLHNMYSCKFCIFRQEPRCCRFSAIVMNWQYRNKNCKNFPVITYNPCLLTVYRIKTHNGQVWHTKQIKFYKYILINYNCYLKNTMTIPQPNLLTNFRCQSHKNGTQHFQQLIQNLTTYRHYKRLHHGDNNRSES